MQNKNVARAICPPDECHTGYGENGSFDSAALRSGRQDRDVSAVGAAIGRPQKAITFHHSHSERPKGLSARRSEESAPPSTPRKPLRMLITLLLAVLLLLSCHSIRQLTAAQTMQYEAERWQGPSEQTYSQVAVFWSDGEMDAGKTQMLAAELQASFPTEEIPPFVTAWGAKSSGLAVYGHRRVEAELWSVSERISLNILLKQLSLINNYQIHCITIAFKDLRRSKDPFQMMMA